MSSDSFIPAWHLAPDGWDWLAQDEDGGWYWYRVRPQPGIGGGVWRAHSSVQAFAGQGSPNADWVDSLRHRHACEGDRTG